MVACRASPLVLVSTGKLACTVETFHDPCDNADLRERRVSRRPMLHLMLMSGREIEPVAAASSSADRSDARQTPTQIVLGGWLAFVVVAVLVHS